MRENLMDIYDRLYRHFGPQHWWPGQTPLEIMIGAVLTQNTNWKNVEKAIDNLKQAALLDAEKLDRLPADELARRIRPAGYFNIKAKRLKALIRWFGMEYRGDPQRIDQRPVDLLRQELLAVNGIGLETADSILLYAFGKPVFVVDTYTARILARHQLITPPVGYQEIQDLFESTLPRDAALFNEYHALLVCCGKQFCKRKPICQGCPLDPLPHEIEDLI